MKSIRLRTVALAIAAGSLMMSTHADAAFAVLSASANPATSMVTITGTDLTAGPKKPQVYLGVAPLEIVGAASSTQIIAVLPPVAPGTYLLTVTNGPGAAQMEEMWITIGAVGPQGPKGDKGDKGDAGAPGAQGPQGIQGIQGPQGVQGVPGQAVTLAQIPVGDPRCPGGGAAISAGGVTANVCGYAPPAPPVVPTSKVIAAADFEQISGWAGLPSGTSWTLCYRMTDHGNSSAAFHGNCNAHDRTFIVARTSTGKVIGGYSSVNWSGGCSYKADADAFLFSITNRFRHGLNASQSSTALFPCQNNGPTFGGGHDLLLNAGAGTSNIGYTYACRPEAGANCIADFAGAGAFTYAELEVFYAP
jgi:hypothetical protein